MGVNWAAGLMRWQPYVAPSGRAYPLNHLHPFRFTLLLPLSSDLGAIDVELEVGFSMHTFTRGRHAADSLDSIYIDARERRTFDHERHALSYRLPEIIRNLSARKCYLARNQNYLCVEVIRTAESLSDYRVFFVLKRLAKDAVSPRPRVRLNVQSAYETHRSGQGTERPIRFHVLMRRVLGMNPASRKRRPRTNAGPRSPNLLDIPRQVGTPKGG
jgi:hypothetical protein